MGPGDLAEEACAIEIDRLSRPVGKQDQYVAAFGGLKCFEFRPDGQVERVAARRIHGDVYDLEEHLLMFFTGYSRDADRVLAEQKERSEGGDAADDRQPARREGTRPAQQGRP